MDDKAKLAWCMFFSAVKGWQYHPGNLNYQRTLSTAECARIADEMLDQYRDREDETWAGWQQHKSEEQ